MAVSRNAALLCLAAVLCAPRARSQTPVAPVATIAWSTETRVLTGLFDAPLRASLASVSASDSVGLRIIGPEAAARALSPALSSAIERAGHRVTPLTDGTDADSVAAAARLAHAETYVLATLSVTGSTLSAQIAVSELSRDAWQTFLATREPAGATRLSLSQDTALSAPTRASLGIALSPRWPAVALGRPRTIATPFRAVLAMAAVDLDRDAREELVMILPDRARAARFTGGSLTFLPDAGSSFAAFASAPMPLRQPLGTIALDPALGVIFRTSQQAVMGALQIAHNQLAATPIDSDLYPASGLGCAALQAGLDAVRAVGPCGAGAAMTAVSAPTAAVPVSVTLTRAGVAVRAEAWPDLNGRVEVRLRDAATERTIRTVTVSDIAAPLCLVDLDDDGDVELLGASASEPGAPDRLRVVTIRVDAVEERPGLSTPGPIEAIATGDVDADGLRDVVLSASDPARHASTLWVLP